MSGRCKNGLGAAIILMSLIGPARGGAAEAFSFVQLCDPQLGIGGYEHDLDSFRKAVAQINLLKPDLVIVCGDLVHRGHDNQRFEDFLAVKTRLTMPCYLAPGNHDIGNYPNHETLANYRKRVGKDYYAFQHKGHTFIIVNTQLWKHPLAGESEAQDQWFRETLRDTAARKSPVIVAGHLPLYTLDPEEPQTIHNIPPKRRTGLLDLLTEHRVVAVLSGHVHANIVHDHAGIQLITTASTSWNLGNTPLGFRLWRVETERPWAHQYVEVEGVTAPVEPNGAALKDLLQQLMN